MNEKIERKAQFVKFAVYLLHEFLQLFNNIPTGLLHQERIFIEQISGFSIGVQFRFDFIQVAIFQLVFFVIQSFCIIEIIAIFL